MAAKLSQGWIASVREGHALVMTYLLDARGKYPQYDGANAIFWVDKERIEVEPLSPEYTLKDGQSATFKQSLGVADDPRWRPGRRPAGCRRVAGPDAFAAQDEVTCPLAVPRPLRDCAHTATGELNE